MNSIKKNFILPLFFLIHFPFLANSQQNNYLDSLNRELALCENTEDSVRILCQLVWYPFNNEAETLFQYGIKAFKLSQRIQDKHLIANAYDAAALGYKVTGDIKKAKELYTRSLEIGKKYNIPERIAWPYFNLASIALFEERDNEKACDYALQARKIFISQGKIGHAIRNDRVLILSNYQRPNCFIDTLLQDIKRLEDIPYGRQELLYCYLNAMVIFEDIESESQSLFYALKALDIAEEINAQNEIIKSCNKIGRYLRDYQHNYEVALAYYQKTLSIYKTKNDKIGIAETLAEIGQVYAHLNNDSLALALFNESLDIATNINHRHLKANAYMDLGNFNYYRKNYTDAQKFYLKCYKTGCDWCPKIIFHKALINVGNVYLNSNEFSKAKEYYMKSLALADSANAPYERALSYSNIAKLYYAQNNHTKAKEYYKKALNIAKMTSSLTIQKEITSNLSKLYFDSKNFEQAYLYLSSSNKLADSISKISVADNLARLETKFDFQKLQMQKKIDQVKATEEINKQVQLRNMFIVGFLFMTILGIVIYFSYLRKKRNNKTLETQRKQIEEMSKKVHEADQLKLRFFTNISI